MQKIHPSHLVAFLALCVGAAPIAQQVTAPQMVELSLGGKTALELDAHWDDFTDSVYRVYERDPILQNFHPAQERATYGDEHFRGILPPGPVQVGDTWKFSPDLVLPFLRQIHPGARSQFRFGRGIAGAFACLRAVSDEHAEILLRVHAEFLLKDSKNAFEQAWLMPAQFAGHMSIDRTRGVVTSFQLGLPPRNTNVDVNVPGDHPGMFIADIGYIPRMEVVSVTGKGNELAFAREISPTEARWRLARRFYAFLEIEWLDVPTALKRSQESGRPLHILTMFGTLDDESC